MKQQSFLKTEIEWRPAPRFEGTHEVSRCGKVRRKECIRQTRSGAIHKRRYKSRIQKQTPNDHGYLRVNLAIGDGVFRCVLVHRLVAEAFCEKPKAIAAFHERNPEELSLVVNHIDHNKKNNHADNLEWVTYSENMQKASRFYRQAAEQELLFN